MREQVSQIKIAVDNIVFFCDFPTCANSWFYSSEPLIINNHKVVFVDAGFSNFVFAFYEVIFNKGFEFFLVGYEVEAQGFLVNRIFDFIEDEAELFGFVIGGRYVPIEVVLIKDFVDVGIGNKGDFVGIECAEKGRRQLLIESAGFAYGQN